MRTVDLISGIPSSALGFGCAPILGSINAKKARKALEYAIECGINHFDLARSYGYGEAESFVGRIIKGRRDKVVLVSKFGIKANWKTNLLNPIKPLYRYVSNINILNISEVKSAISKPISNQLFERVPFNSKEMKKSLEQSLKALKTDYLDYLLLHEPIESLINFEDLFKTYDTLKHQGKIRGWGLAYTRNQEYLHKDYLDRFDILQFDNSPGTSDYDTLKKRRGLKSNILFSPINSGLNNLSPKEKLSKLFLDFPNSVIVCSMFNEQHIKENVELLFR
jgi:aryl-alcohol dehydrogenase-like predicted oxidoreductase